LRRRHAGGAEALLGEQHAGWTALERVRDRALVALAAEMCGGAERVPDMITEYAKRRNRPRLSPGRGWREPADFRLCPDACQPLRYFVRQLPDLVKQVRTPSQRPPAVAIIGSAGGIPALLELLAPCYRAFRSRSSSSSISPLLFRAGCRPSWPVVQAWR
jgi:alkylation response protein AidB-like acyl-CoA dehydrogenase